MQADHLAGLLRALDLGPAMIVGGSGGARVSLLTATNHPDVASGLAMLWISGGVYGLLLLATHYCGESIRAAWSGGMEAVVDLPEWAEVLERNPRNRDRFLAQDPRAFIDTLEHWMLAYCPDPAVTVPGLPDAACRALGAPTLIFRSGESDPHHTRATSERLHELIPGSRLVEPPWPDDEWIQRGRAAADGHRCPVRALAAARAAAARVRRVEVAGQLALIRRTQSIFERLRSSFAATVGSSAIILRSAPSLQTEDAGVVGHCVHIEGTRALEQERHLTERVTRGQDVDDSVVVADHQRPVEHDEDVPGRATSLQDPVAGGALDDVAPGDAALASSSVKPSNAEIPWAWISSSALWTSAQ